MTYLLSILIPARNEQFLAKTVENILENIESDTEIIVGLDGQLAEPSIPQHERVTVVFYPQSIGQRSMTNQLCKLSKAKYVMKVDAHCAFDKGFDRKLIEAMEGHGDWTIAPIMRNLHAFDWVCKKCGDRRYQGPTPTSCPKCDNTTDFEKDILWIGKNSPQSKSYCFDSEPHFQYFGEWCKTPTYLEQVKTGLTESMSLQGSCFMMTRDRYWELNICDEAFGSWGSQGIEVAVKSWLSGGKVMICHNTWYAHMFRTQGGDFGFPYPIRGSDQERAKHFAKNLFFNNKWEKAIHPLSWLVEKFWPVKGWEEKDLIALKGTIPKAPPTKKGIIFYTDNQLNLKIAHTVQKQLKSIGLPIISTSLKPMNFGKNIFCPLVRGYLTMFKQILTALENSTAEYIFFCEHDVLYHPSHFDFTPPTKDKFYYNENFWKINAENGHAVHYDAKQVSGICVDRELAIKHYRKRVEMVEKNGFNMGMGFEPGTHHREERVDDLQSEGWMSEYPNVDIRHGGNLSKTRWHKEEFRDQRNCPNWLESDIEIPGWGKNQDIINSITK
jgi:rubrerythrin